MLEPEAGLDGAAFQQVRSILRHHHGVLLAPGGIHGLNKLRQQVFTLHWYQFHHCERSAAIHAAGTPTWIATACGLAMTRKECFCNSWAHWTRTI